MQCRALRWYSAGTWQPPTPRHPTPLPTQVLTYGIATAAVLRLVSASASASACAARAALMRGTAAGTAAQAAPLPHPHTTPLPSRAHTHTQRQVLIVLRPPPPTPPPTHTQRQVLIVLGVDIVDHFRPVLLLFAAILVFSSYKLLRWGGVEHPSRQHPLHDAVPPKIPPPKKNTPSPPPPCLLPARARSWRSRTCPRTKSSGFAARCAPLTAGVPKRGFPNHINKPHAHTHTHTCTSLRHGHRHRQRQQRKQIACPALPAPHPTTQFITFSDGYDGDRFWTVGPDGSRLATPLLLVLLVVELSDVVFAVDSIPAVSA